MVNISDILILDTWAFIEEIFEGARRDDVDAERRKARRLVTTRDVILETYSYVLRRARPEYAREWFTVVRESPLEILEPTLAETEDILRDVPRPLGLSLVDVSLVWIARKVQSPRIATGDRAFADVGLQPLFA